MQEEIDKAYDIGYKEVVGNIHENGDLLEEKWQ